MVDWIMGFLGRIIYPLFSIIFMLIDGIQDIFKAFAGTGDVTVGKTDITAGNSGATTDTGIVYYMFQHKIVKDLLLSIMLLALFLIIIFTAMAFIKNAYSSKPKKWQEIVGNAFIGLANFIFIPVCCLLGVWLGNILLNAIDGATNINGATSMSKQLFVSAAYNANGFREEDHDLYELTQDEALAYVKSLVQNNGLENKIEVGTPPQDMDYREYCAEIVDKVYAQSDIDITWWWNVNDNYTLISINYVILAGGGIFLITALVNISFGMVKRLFTLLLLFVISPALCAMYPLDDGNAVKQWKGDFVKNTISAYGAVAGLNLFFSIMPLIQQIKLNNVLDTLGLTSVLLSIAGLYMVKDFISMISGYVGGKDAYSEGASLAKSVGSRVKGGAKKVGAFIGGTTKSIVRAAGAKGEGGSFFGSLASQAGTGALNMLTKATGIDVPTSRKGYEDLMKEGKQSVIDKRERAEKGELKSELKKLDRNDFIDKNTGKIDAAKFLDEQKRFVQMGGSADDFKKHIYGKNYTLEQRQEWEEAIDAESEKREEAKISRRQNGAAMFTAQLDDDERSLHKAAQVEADAQLQADATRDALRPLFERLIEETRNSMPKGKGKAADVARERFEASVERFKESGNYHDLEISKNGLNDTWGKFISDFNSQLRSVSVGKGDEKIDTAAFDEAARKVKEASAKFEEALTEAYKSAEQVSRQMGSLVPTVDELREAAKGTGKELEELYDGIKDSVKKSKK